MYLPFLLFFVFHFLFSSFCGGEGFLRSGAFGVGGLVRGRAEGGFGGVPMFAWEGVG